MNKDEKKNNNTVNDNSDYTITGNSDLPLGLGMAFSQNTKALECFAAMPRDKQKSIIDKAQNIKSRSGMQSLVDSLSSEG